MSTVVLVGFMGAGKTTIGHALARLQKLPFHDLDEILERRFALSIPEVFARHGEAAFRMAEGRVLREALADSSAVIAAGGGAFCSPENRNALRQAGASSVYIDVPWEVLWLRIAATGTSRPLLADVETTRALFERRLPDYRRADYAVTVAAQDRPADVAARIAELVAEAACGT